MQHGFKRHLAIPTGPLFDSTLKALQRQLTAPVRMPHRTLEGDKVGYVFGEFRRAGERHWGTGRGSWRNCSVAMRT